MPPLTPLIPNAAEVVRRRWTVATCLRVGALGLAMLGFYPLLSWLTEGLRDGDLWDVSWYWGRMLLSVLLPGMGAACFFLAGWVSRLLVPIRRHAECPVCRHRIEGVTEARCTECGLTLTEEFLTGQSPGGTGEPDYARLVMIRRGTVTTVFRVVGVLGAPIAGLWAVGLVMIIGMWVWDKDVQADWEFFQLVNSALQAVVWTGAVLVLLFKAPSLARFCVPFDRTLAKTAGSPEKEPTGSGPDPASSGG